MSAQAIQALGWALIHFLWQGALVALLLEIVLCFLREHSARSRYVVRCAALLVMGLLPLATWAWLARAGAPALAALEIVPEAVPARIEEYLAAVVAAEEAARRGQMLGWLVAAWALGASLCTARMLRDYLRLRRLQSSAAGCALPGVWQVRFDFLARRMRVSATARVVDSAALAAPAVIGWLRPVVLIPARALTGLSGAELELVLAHELAHIARADYAINLLQSALEALLFYHPAVWWVSQGIRTEREFCCDDAALARSSDGVVYARALATLEGWRNVQPALGLSTLGGPLMIRIQRLIGIRPSARPVRGPLSALGAILALGCASAMAHDPAETSSADRVAALRKQIEEIEQKLDELRASLDEAETEEVGGLLLEEPGHVTVEAHDPDECAEHEKAHKKVKAVVIDGDWGDWSGAWAEEWGDWGEEWAEEWGDWAGEDLKEKIHAHMGEVHEHLKHLHGGDGAEVEVDGEATIEIIIQTDDGPPRHIKKRIPIDGKGYKVLWLGGDEDGEGEDALGLELSGGERHRWNLGGLHPLLLQHGDGDEAERNVHVLKLKELLGEHGIDDNVHVLKLKGLLEAHGVDDAEHREHLLKLHELLEGKLKPLQKLKLKQSKDGAPLLLEVQPDEAPEEASSGAREVV